MRLTVNLHHDGNFVPSPLMYLEGEKSIIRDLEFEGMTLIRLSKLLQGTCMFLVKGIFFLIPGKELSNGLIEIKNDLDLANCIATDIDNNDDELSDVEMEDITGYGASDFVGEDDVIIPNRSINDPFLNKLCNGSYINDFTDKSDGGESSQPSAKELEIDSDDEDVDKNFKLVDGVIYPEFDPKLSWNEMKPTLGLRFEHPEQLKECMTNYGVANGYQLWYRRNDYRSLFVLCGRELGEGRSGGQKGKKRDWPYKKEKNEGELPKKDKGALLRSPMKGKKRAYIRSPSKKGTLVTFKWIAKQFALKIIEDLTITYRSIQEQIKKKYLINVSVGQCKRAKQRALFDHEGGLIEHYSRLWDYRKQLLDTNPGSSVHLHKTAKIIKDAIATRKLKTAGLKRRCKSERIAKGAKPFQFVKDGAGSCSDKAWDVDEVLAEE
ncbi:hypothetical protein Tco_0951408 [Tanacetum coccineum]|uniref:PB1-like domain-containing protein n=1 Tax=Tanacetum coccineum TaxID=301880 RepID=A0ABQ5DVT2_9ASTR